MLEYPEDLNPFDEKEEEELEYPTELNPFGDTEVVVPPPRLKKSQSSANLINTAAAAVSKMTKSQSSVSLFDQNATIRKKSRKKSRAPSPPKGVKPFSVKDRSSSTVGPNPIKGVDSKLLLKHCCKLC